MMTRREALLAIGAALAGCVLLGAAFYALVLRSGAAGGIEGVIVSRRLEAAPETQITVGAGGVRRRELPGVCQFVVQAADGSGARLYTITVDPATYASHQVGDRFYFVRPPR